MRLKRLAIALTGAATLAAVAISAPAQADLRTLDTDQVKINEVGFDFGTGTYNNVELSNHAPVEWLVDENDVTPHITGTLHLAGVVNECARMRIDYYSSAGIFLTTKFGGTVCAPDNGWNRWSVDLDPYTSDKIGQVKVSIEVQLPNNTYSITGSDWSTLSAFVDDEIRVAEWDGGGLWGVGFGGTGWTDGNPLSFGEVDWNFSGGQITPHLTGRLHLESAAGDCFRMRIDYFSDDGPDAGTADDLLTTVFGGTVCALDNSHQQWTVDRDDYSGSTIRKVKVSIEEQTGPSSWTIVDSAFSFFGT